MMYPQQCAFYGHCQFYQLWQDVYTQTEEQCCYSPPQFFFHIHQAVGSTSQ